MAAAAAVTVTSFAGDVLTGTTRFACEALLCLSTGAPPGECSPGLAAYYAIHGATPADTRILRKAFLLTCPTGGAGSSGAALDVPDEHLDSLVDAIVYGADGVNLKKEPQPYRDEKGKLVQPNYYEIYDNQYGQAYRDHAYTVDIPDNRGLYINGQKAIREDGKVYLTNTTGAKVQYTLYKGRYVPSSQVRKSGFKYLQ